MSETKSDEPELTGVVRQMIKDRKLPRQVLIRSRNGIYLMIETPVKVGDIAEISLWHGDGDDQHPLIHLSWRYGTENFLVQVGSQDPNQLLVEMAAKVLPSGEKTAVVKRDLALIVVEAMLGHFQPTTR